MKEKSPDGHHGGAFYSLYTNVSFWLSDSSVNHKTKNLLNCGSVLSRGLIIDLQSMFSPFETLLGREGTAGPEVGGSSSSTAEREVGV